MKTLAAVWVGGLILASVQPLRPGAAVSAGVLHRPAHFVIFVLTTVILWRFFRAVKWTLLLPPAFSSRDGFKAAFATTVIGTVIEILQHLVYHSPLEWWDIRDDTLAAIATALILEVMTIHSGYKWLPGRK